MLTVAPQNTPVVPAEQTETCAQGHKTSIQTQVCSPPKVVCPLLPNINLPKTENDTAVCLHKPIYFFALHTAGLHIPASLAVRYGLVVASRQGNMGRSEGPHFQASLVFQGHHLSLSLSAFLSSTTNF